MAAFAMSRAPQSIFREAAIDRLSSPDQLDQVVGVTRPVDWMAAAVVALAILMLLVWSVVGAIPTRVAGDGIVLGSGGKVADAAASAGGRLRTVFVTVGDRVKLGQPIAELAQDDAGERYRAAAALLSEREREHAALTAATDRERAAQDSSFSARKAGLQQSAAAAEDRATVLAGDLKTMQGLVKQGLTTEPDLEQTRVDLYAARQRGVDARNAILTLSAERLDRQAQQARELLASQVRVDDARRESGQLAAALARQTEVVSPIAGRITEIKVSPGAVLVVGAPVASIESAENRLQAVVYLPAESGKLVKPGMRARVAPASVKREEFGAVMGRVVSVSPFPATPEGLAAVLHNADLATRFSRAGALYGAVIQFDADPASPSGYRWSSGHGPDLRLTAGTLAHAEIVTRERRPIELLVPLARRMTGSGG
jgi:HlyD family secretion protein